MKKILISILLSYAFIINSNAQENNIQKNYKQDTSINSLDIGKDINELNAKIWLTEFNKLLMDKQWVQAKYAFELAEKNFSNTKYWSGDSVAKNINYFKYNYAAFNWKAGTNNNSFWLISDTNDKVGAGIQRDPYGNFWLVFASKEKSFECNNSCNIIFKNGEVIHNINFKQSNNTIGAIIPIVLLNNKEQSFEISFPNDSTENFNFSYLPYVIRYHFKLN